MDVYDLFFYLALGAGFLNAFNLGANDVANSMASAVGARAITVRQAVLIAAVLNFVGAVLLGSHVTATISKGIINTAAISDPKLMMIGMFSALIAAAGWVFLATMTALPVSSTHAIVGAIMGFGLVAGGFGSVQWGVMGAIVLSWFISPFFAATIAYLVFAHIRRTILFAHNFVRQAKRWAPVWVALTVALLGLSFLFKTPIGKLIHLPWYWTLALVAGLSTVVWAIGVSIMSRTVLDPEEGAEAVERLFRKMQVGTSCYVALSQGANDVANAIGPVAAIYLIAKHQIIATQTEVPMFILVIGGLGIAVGIMALGYKVMDTVGEKITTLTNTRGFAVDFSAASTVLLASKLGLPVSTTHAAVGGVVGVGLARGFGAVDFRVLGRIVIYWVLTVPFAALSSMLLFIVLKWIFY
ncbi:MAG: inorganic phosphate transporter [Desulfovibrionaceae bacterium]